MAETTNESTKFTKTNSADPIQFSIGIIADVQYASSADGSDFKKTVVRRYRNSLRLLEAAVNAWGAQEDTHGYPVQLVLQLGDLLDGRCQETNGDRDACLGRIMNQFTRLTNVRRIDVIGNHELYNFSRAELNDPAGPLRTACIDELTQRPSTYSSVVVSPGLRIVVLDAYEISTLNGEQETSTTEAFDYLAVHNPNDIATKGVDWAAGLEGSDTRYVPYNGAISQRQLLWLSATLRLALAKEERCCVVSHVSLQQGACAQSCVVWNYKEVIDRLHNPTGNGSTPVVACFYGHAHHGGYIKDTRGIHHVTLQSPLEAIGDELAFATLDVYAQRIVLRGEGRVPSRELDFPVIQVENNNSKV